jgi:hypothetical protein
MAEAERHPLPSTTWRMRPCNSYILVHRVCLAELQLLDARSVVSNSHPPVLVLPSASYSQTRSPIRIGFVLTKLAPFRRTRLMMSNSPDRSRGAFAPGVFEYCPPRSRGGGAPTGARCLRGTGGACRITQDARERAYVTRQARALARRPDVPCDRDAAPLGAPPWRFWAGGRASISGISSRSVQRAPRSQVVVPGGRGPHKRVTTSVNTPCLPSPWLRATTAGRHSPLRLQDRLRRRPSMSRDMPYVAWARDGVNIVVGV